jgi:hypothetical protein
MRRRDFITVIYGAARPCYRCARRSDFVDGMGRLELHPVDAGLVTVSQAIDPRYRLALSWAGAAS